MSDLREVRTVVQSADVAPQFVRVKTISPDDFDRLSPSLQDDVVQITSSLVNRKKVEDFVEQCGKVFAMKSVSLVHDDQRLILHVKFEKAQDAFLFKSLSVLPKELFDAKVSVLTKATELALV